MSELFSIAQLLGLIGPAGAAEAPRDPYQQYIGGRVRGGEGGAGGSGNLPAPTGGAQAAPEMLPPNQMSQAGPSAQAQLRELADQQRTLMQLGPMVPALVRLGVTPAQMRAMNPAEAYQFIKARSPQGMGTVDPNANRSVMDTIEKLRQQRGIINNSLLENK